jgi:hypothetical protein
MLPAEAEGPGQGRWDQHASVIQRAALKFLQHKKAGTLVFRNRARHLFGGLGPRGLPPWLEAINDDTRRTMAESPLAAQLERYILEFTTGHVPQPQKAEVMHRLVGTAFMSKHHPLVAPNPTALGPPYLDAEEVAALVDELRRDLLAHVAAKAAEDNIHDSRVWRETEQAATIIAMTHYRDEVAQQPAKRNPLQDGAAKRQVQREQLRLELEGLAAGLDAVLTQLPAEIPGVLEMLRGRRLTPRLRQLMWRKKLVTPEHVAAVARKMERTRADPAGQAPLPALMGHMVQAAMASNLQLYATTHARLQAVVDTFGGLFLLRDSFEHTGLRYDVDACAPLTCIYCQLVFDMC